MRLWNDTKRQTVQPSLVSRSVLSDTRTYLWFPEQLTFYFTALPVPITIELVGKIDLAALNKSLNQIIQRYDLLRATFSMSDGQLRHNIVPKAVATLAVIDLSDLADIEQERRVQQIVKQQVQSPFDLTRAPLLRATVLKRHPEKYVLFLALHRLVGDLRSAHILIDDIAAWYRTLTQNIPLALPSPPRQYTDLVCQEKGWLEKDSAQALLAYWKAQLGGRLPVLELPTDRPRPAVKTTQGARLTFSFPSTLIDSLQTTRLQLGVDLPTILLATFKTLLYRYTGQEDILVGSPFSNRQSEQAKNLVGPLEDILVFRTDLSGDCTFRTLLERVDKTIQAAYAHQGLPFFILLRTLQLGQASSHPPIFQVMFDFRDVPPTSKTVADLAWRYLKLDYGISEYDLSLVVEKRDNKIIGVFEYNTDLFDAETIERLIGHFQTLLTAIAADPDKSLAQLPILTEPERQQLLVNWNQTRTDFGGETCAHTLFETQAHHAPDAVALVCGQKRLTYRELNQRANQLAHHLQSLGVGPEALIGLYLERSIEFVVAALAVLKAGGAYAPIDPTYPQERVAFMLADTQTPVLLTQSSLAHELPPHNSHVVCLVTDWDTIAKHDDLNPSNEVRPHNLAYVIYTSGSTGQPKGVQITHKGLSNLIHWHQRTFEISSQDWATQLAGLGFDASVWEIWPYLTAGATLDLVDEQTRLDPEKLQDWLLSGEKTVCFLPTPLAESLLSLDWPDESPLRLILTGGDKLHRYPSPFVPFELVNNYGPTENTVVTTSCRLAPQDRTTAAPPIGKPIDNVQVYVLDRHMRPTPIGVVGELYIGGESLARGYLKRPAQTAQSFVPDPFSPTPGARLYKTGDLVRYKANGNIDFVGRTDFQVKVRGYRIELGEIESILDQHPHIESVVARVQTGPSDTTTDKQLIAYFVPKAESSPTKADLRRYLQDKLPAYMIPSAFVQLDAMPLTPHGKIDLSALPRPTRQDAQTERDFTAPRNPIELVLASIWEQVLNLEKVGIYDNFFALGGHSLLATQIVSRIRDTFKVELPLPVLFKTCTVASLAKRIELARQTDQGLSAPPVRAVTRGSKAPLSFSQQRLWFLDQFTSGKPLYNVQIVRRLVGSLNVSALEKSINEIVRRHKILRTNFVATEGQPLQVVAPNLTLPLPITNLSHLGPAEQEAHMQCVATQEIQHAFDLTQGPLLRLALLRQSQQEHVLLVTLHHIIFDGWSVGVFFQELSALYRAFCAAEPSPLAELPIQYADFAAWQQKWLRGKSLDAQLSYWTEKLDGAPSVLELPTTYPRPSAQNFAGASERFSLDREQTHRLQELGAQEGASLYMILLAAFQTLLYRYTGQERINVGTYIANRNRVKVEALIGFFINTLVISTDLSGNPTFRQLLRRARETTLGAYAHQDLPFEKLLQALQPKRNPGYTPLFQVMLVLQNLPDYTIELPELTIEPFEIERGTCAHFDLTFWLWETDDGLDGQIDYNVDLFDAASITRMLGHLQTLLEGIITDPDQRLSDLPLLTPVEKRQLLYEVKEAPASASQCVHELFEAQAAKNPNAPAVVMPCSRGKAQTLTYGELNRRANQLAHHLQSLGVGPETLVGICLERSLDMVVGLLGILKAGGAYVPLDPMYPSERLAFMLVDCQIDVLLTQAALLNVLPKHNAQIVCLDRDWESIAQTSTDNPDSGLVVENLAYVIYTSGSTGKPKGVAIQHNSLASYTQVANLRYTLGPSDRVLQFASINFDASAEEIYPGLTSGATLVLRTDSMIDTAATFVEKCRQWKLSVLNLPTAYWHQLTTALDRENLTLPSSIRLVIIGGERAVPEKLIIWQQRINRDLQLINTYGPTEATIVATMRNVQNWKQPDTTLREVPIGPAIPTIQAYVLDQHLQPTPLQVPGELYLGGEGLARNYLERPGLTAERFIPNPFSSTPGTRLYKTGDLVRHLPNGDLEFLGRTDHQVKIRGFRVELGEIETLLRQHPAVRDTVVMAREPQSKANVKQLVAYVVPRQQPPPDMGELRRFLKQSLPDYMVPLAYITLDALPLTPSGKIDHRALPAPDSVRPELEQDFIAPSTPFEEILAEIWQKVLGLDQIGVYDNFFDLGGHSLLATQIVSRVQYRFEIDLPLSCLFEAPTIADMASQIERALVAQIEALEEAQVQRLLETSV